MFTKTQRYLSQKKIISLKKINIDKKENFKFPEKMGLMTAHNDAEFESIISSSQSTIVMFKDEHCVQCKKIKPSFVRRAQKYTTKQFLLVDINDIQNYKLRTSIKGMPTFSKYKSGKKISTFTGADKPRLDHLIKY